MMGGGSSNDYYSETQCLRRPLATSMMEPSFCCIDVQFSTILECYALEMCEFLLCYWCYAGAFSEGVKVYLGRHWQTRRNGGMWEERRKSVY